MISIIIITKNEEKMLPRLLESIKNQSYKGYEVIVPDANSTDKTREITQKKYKCGVIEGGLPSAGRNNGAKNARGEILLFLDSDVMLPKEFLEKNIKEFNSRELVSATPFYRPLSKRLIDKIMHHIYNAFARIMQYISPHAAGFCIFCKRDIFIKTGGFDENVRFAEDHTLVNETKKYGKFRVLRSVPILVDVRRMNKEGRIGTIRKYLLADLYRLFRGKIYNPPFSYDMQGVNMKKSKIRI